MKRVVMMTKMIFDYSQLILIFQVVSPSTVVVC
jgi:hypothetical protein